MNGVCRRRIIEVEMDLKEQFGGTRIEAGMEVNGKIDRGLEEKAD